MQASNLALFWAGVIALSILIYVILDGVDLGIGILFGFSGNRGRRQRMVDVIAPFWDGNETWLVMVAASLFAAFPTVYAVFLSAFYVPVLLLLFGLIFRGIAFEFRSRTVHFKWLWDWGFSIGSLLVAFVQGAALGAMMRGIPVVDGQYAGGTWDWLHPFPVFAGIGLVLGYALLGAGWLVFKGEGELREWAYTRIRHLVIAVCLVLGIALAIAMTVDSNAIAQGTVPDRRWGVSFPIISIAALLGVIVGVHVRRDGVPFLMTVVFFVAAYFTLGVMLWPNMVPYTVTIADAAAPDASLGFIFWGGVIVLPVILVYTLGIYRVFRGKTQRTYR